MKWMDSALIPNEEGRRVEVLLADGQVKTTRVVRDPRTGLHSLEGVAIADVRGWRRP